jgi:hypothetical protein
MLAKISKIFFSSSSLLGIYFKMVPKKTTEAFRVKKAEKATAEA